MQRQIERVCVAVLSLLLWAAPATADGIDSRLQQHITYLADDARDGRGIGTKGLDEAAVYLAAQYESLGLLPAFNGGFFQPFTMGWGVELGPTNHLTLGALTLDTTAGIMPLGFSSPGVVRGKVVFAGYAITAPEYDYDDFGDLETQDALVLCMTGEPGEFDTTSVFEGVNYTTHSTLRAKASNAKLNGAAALLMVEGPVYAGAGDEKLRTPRADEPYIDCGIPAMRITRAAVAQLFPEFDLEAVQKFIDGNAAPRSFALKADTVEIAVDLTRQSVEVKNVAAIIPGDSTVIVIGAHYDHLGYGQSGSLDETPGQVHNGADDNASGAAAIVEIARLLKDNPITSTVLAVSFTAEEVGLGGSGHIVEHFPLNIKNVRAMINLDMLGRMQDGKLTAVGCKTAEEFPAIVEEANKSVGLNVTCKGDGYGPSDHMNFYLVDIPVLYLSTGAHADYHRSSDDVDKINFPDLVRGVEFTANVVREIDRRAQPLTFVKTSEPQPQSGRFRSSFGSIPDFSQPDSVKGMLLSGVRDGGAAALAGLERGDLLKRLGKVTINNIYDLTYALQVYAPGDSVVVEYERRGEPRTAHTVLQQSTR